jgi:hypothetical protein
MLGWLVALIIAIPDGMVWGELGGDARLGRLVSLLARSVQYSTTWGG